MSLASVFPRLFSHVPSRRFAACSVLLAAALAAPAVLPVQAQSPGDLEPDFLSQLSGGTFYSLYRYDYVDVDGVPQQFLVGGGDTALFKRLVLPEGVTNDLDTVPAFGNVARIVYTIVQDKYVHPNKFFVGGAFGASTTQTIPQQNIFRLNPDFTLDDPETMTGLPSFNPGEGADRYVTSILPTADGKVVVAGEFVNFNNVAHLRIVRLTDNSDVSGVIDGTIDSTFDPNLSFDATVLSLAEQLDPATSQPNGQILVAGTFNNVDTTAQGKLARINTDGSIDTTFTPVIDLRVTYVTVQPDGKILIAGDFTTVDGVTEMHLARLNFDGSLDTMFSATVTDQITENNVNPVSVYTITVLTDGRMYVGGNFLKVNGVRRQYLALLNADGSVDTGFDPGTNIANSVQAVLPDTSDTGYVFVGETVSPKGNSAKFQPSLIALYPPAVNSPAFTNAPAPRPISPFFTGDLVVGDAVYYLRFTTNSADSVFGFHTLQTYPYVYHFDLGYEYVIDANDGNSGVYLYDFASGTFFYTSPTFYFPYLYDFSLDTVLYYFPVGSASPGRYTTNPRYFYDFATGQVITK